MQTWLPAQIWPHIPQFWAFSVVFTHRPLQMVKPVGQLHLPLVQLVPPVHVTPHAPQLFSSEFVFVHCPPHDVKPLQLCWQLPPMQTWPAAQALPHIPQFWGSVLMFVQRPLQFVKPPLQLHCPLTHGWPIGQT